MISRLPLFVISLGILAAIVGPLLWLGNLEPSTNETTLQCLDCSESDVIRVIDGDTLNTSDGRIRLYGVDAPEEGERCAPESSDRLRELAGSSVRLQKGPRERDSFERLLAYLYTEDGNSIDEMLIKEGLATAWTEDGQHRNFLVALEREARNNRTGCLW